MYSRIIVSPNGVFTEDGRLLTPSDAASLWNPPQVNDFMPQLHGGRVNYDRSNEAAIGTMGNPPDQFQFQRPSPMPWQAVQVPNYYGMSDVRPRTGETSYYYPQTSPRVDQPGFGVPFHGRALGGGRQVRPFKMEAKPTPKMVPVTSFGDDSPGKGGASPKGKDPLGGLTIYLDGVPINIDAAKWDPKNPKP